MCLRMTHPSQLEIVRSEIADIKAEILNTREALAAAQGITDIDFLRKQLEQLNNTRNLLLQKEHFAARPSVR